MTALILHEVSISLGGARILDHVSMSVPSGTRTALVGASGSGKTTLLRLIAGFARPDAGTITLGEHCVAGPNEFVPAHRRGVGYVPQDGALFPHLTVAANIGFGLPRAERTIARIAAAADLVALPAGLLQRFPHEISGGQQQRVAVARALIPEPGMIVLDEPFSSLDTGLREHSRVAVIDALEASEATAVLVTHDQDEALMFGHDIGVLADGRLLQHGTPASVFDNPVSADVATFLGEALFLSARLHSDAQNGTVAETAFGPIPVRHVRRSADAGGVGGIACRVMLRPGQLRVQGASECNGTITAIRHRGATTQVEVTALGGHETDRGGRETVIVNVTVPEPIHRLGQNVVVAVWGSAVAY